MACNAASLKRFGITQEQVDRVGAILNEDSAPYSRLEKLMKYAFSEGLAWVADGCTCGMFIVHPANRSALMLDWLQSHKLLEDVKSIGANREKLKECHAFELPSDCALRDKFFEKNRELVQLSDGCLAPVTGKERYALVGGSHFTTGMKAADARCCTPLEGISLNGHLSADALKLKDKTFEGLFNDGWAFTIWKGDLSIATPDLPSFLERTLNAGNTTNRSKTELQCFFDLHTRLAAGGTEQAAIQVLVMVAPECKEYLGAMATIAKLFVSTGEAITVLHVFSARFGESKKLGCEYLASVLTKQTTLCVVYNIVNTLKTLAV